jgi:hypothetical protein
VRHPITADYIDVSGKEYKLLEGPRWKKSLGKRILLVDIDTRLPDKENEIMGEKPVDWEKHQSIGGGLVTNGIMDHYLYGRRILLPPDQRNELRSNG